jgi:glycosyltransferase involved in cell wall biosynthesis
VGSRPLGLSAFVRCKNEEEYVVASLLSIYEACDEILVILNNSTDRTRALVEDMMRDHNKIRLAFYESDCAPSGPGYLDTVRKEPSRSLAAYYNWCLAETRYSHVCKWDGDMIAIPAFRSVRGLFPRHDVVLVDGYDIMGEYTTDVEPRVFRYDVNHVRYVDWELYEVLSHDYTSIGRVPEKCYLHMKLAKQEWLHRKWICPNNLLPAEATLPRAERPRVPTTRRLTGWVRSARRRLGRLYP